MFVDGWDCDLKKFGDELLGEPNGLVFKTYFEGVFSGLGGKNEKLGGGIADVHEEGLWVVACGVRQN